MIKYRCGDRVGLGADMNEDLPVIGKIVKLYAIENKILLQVVKFRSEYEPHYRAYMLHQIPEATTQHVSHVELLMPAPVHIRSTSALSNKFCILPYVLYFVNLTIIVNWRLKHD